MANASLEERVAFVGHWDGEYKSRTPESFQQRTLAIQKFTSLKSAITAKGAKTLGDFIKEVGINNVPSALAGACDEKFIKSLLVDDRYYCEPFGDVDVLSTLENDVPSLEKTELLILKTINQTVELDPRSEITIDTVAELLPEEKDNIYEDEFCRVVFKEKMATLKDKPRSNRYFRIDFDKNIDEIISEIQFLYHALRVDEPDFNETWWRLIDLKNQKKGGLKRLPKSESRNLCRAVGLWLWDYCNEKNIPPEHQAKSFAAFHEKYHSPDSDPFIEEYQNDKQLAVLLERTRECIEKCEVLPMS